MEFFVPPAEAEEWYRYWVDERLALAHALRRPREPAARARARRRRALALLARDERHRVPLPDRLVGARGDREPRRLRPDPAHRGVRDEARVGRPGRRALHAARDRARARRQPLDARVPDRRLRRGGRRRARADGAAAAPAARARQGRRPAARRQERGHGREGARALRGAAHASPASSTTTAGRSAGATAARTRSERRSRSRSTSRRSRTRRSRSATATRSRRSGFRSAARAPSCSTGSRSPGGRPRPTSGAGARAAARRARSRTSRRARCASFVCRTQRFSANGPSSTLKRTSSTPRPAAAMLGQDVDVGEVGQPRVGRVDRAREADLRAAVKDPDDPIRALDQASHHLPLTTGRPVRLLRDEAVHRVHGRSGRGRRRARTRPGAPSSRPNRPHADEAAALGSRRISSVRMLGRALLLLAVTLPLTALDLAHKLTVPTEEWAYHPRGAFWIAMSAAVAVSCLALTRVPSAVVAVTAGVLSAGALGNGDRSGCLGSRDPEPAGRRARRRPRRVQRRGRPDARRDRAPDGRAQLRHDPQPRAAAPASRVRADALAARALVLTAFTRRACAGGSRRCTRRTS